jgi:hypothetical protein
MNPQLVRTHLDSLVKPPGSLGRLEDLAVQLCVIQRTLAPRTTPRSGGRRWSTWRSRTRRPEQHGR